MIVYFAYIPLAIFSGEIFFPMVSKDLSPNTLGYFSMCDVRIFFQYTWIFFSGEILPRILLPTFHKTVKLEGPYTLYIITRGLTQGGAFEGSHRKKIFSGDYPFP
jgi:hypothetical protein